MQTHCRVSLNITPTWPNGKEWKYKSQVPAIPTPQAAPAEPAVQAAPAPEPAQAAPEPAPAAPAPPTPNKRHRTVLPVAVAEDNQNACQICGQEEEISFWIGCGYKNRVTKRETCHYWVHQSCIGLKFKSREKLRKTPFFCPKHIK